MNIKKLNYKFKIGWIGLIVLIFLGLYIGIPLWREFTFFMIFDVVPVIITNKWIMAMLIIALVMYLFKTGAWYEKEDEPEKTTTDLMNDVYRKINKTTEEKMKEVEEQYKKQKEDISTNTNKPRFPQEDFEQESPYRRETIRVYSNQQESTPERPNRSGIGSPIRKLLTWVSMQPGPDGPIEKSRKRKRRPFKPNAGTFKLSEMSKTFQQAARWAAHKAGLELKEIDKEDI